MFQKETDVTYLNKENFNDEIRLHEGFILIEAFAIRNGNNHMITPIIKEVYDKFEIELKYCRLDVNDESFVASKLKVESAPSFVIMFDGKVVDRINGLLQKKVLMNKLKIAIRSARVKMK